MSGNAMRNGLIACVAVVVLCADVGLAEAQRGTEGGRGETGPGGRGPPRVLRPPHALRPPSTLPGRGSPSSPKTGGGEW